MTNISAKALAELAKRPQLFSMMFIYPHLLNKLSLQEIIKAFRSFNRTLKTRPEVAHRMFLDYQFSFLNHTHQSIINWCITWCEAYLKPKEPKFRPLPEGPVNIPTGLNEEDLALPAIPQDATASPPPSATTTSSYSNVKRKLELEPKVDSGNEQPDAVTTPGGGALPPPTTA